MAEEKPTGKPPVKKVRFGGMTASVWENESKEGRKFHTISMERAYRDANDEWQNTQTLRHSDLPKAILVLQKVYEAIPELLREANAETPKEE